ncbi:MAG: hypothetical protein R3E32_21330 [Chitinophagales bacterium]
MAILGILKGTNAQINQRLKEKLEQTKKSDALNLPAYVVVVEFSKPICKIRHTMNKTKKVNNLHEQAMTIADEAFLAERAKEEDKAMELYQHLRLKNKRL